ncbi:MAG: hypothetical protein DRI61_14540 [Chloroflexi bacterium]|nr:MAG: hypothetical protein DRI61_14540 [Chloroflexota bacterium]
MGTVKVLDAEGRELTPTTEEKARKLLAQGKASLVREEPFTIQLPYSVQLPERPEPVPPGRGKRILLHVCCAPCATYTVNRLRELEFDVTGFWYNPNIHPYTEHQRRLEALREYAARISLPLIEEPGYEMVCFLRRVAGRERFRERCRICYEMRLRRTAERARERGFDAFTTTLLISPYQDQDAIREIGGRLAQETGVEFFFENFRRCWAERGRISKEHNLYRQQYCGCIYSEWERYDQEGVRVFWAGEKGCQSP